MEIAKKLSIFISLFLAVNLLILEGSRTCRHTRVCRLYQRKWKIKLCMFYYLSVRKRLLWEAIQAVNGLLRTSKEIIFLFLSAQIAKKKQNGYLMDCLREDKLLCHSTKLFGAIILACLLTNL